MNEATTGLPRSGKTKQSVIEIVNELISSNRPIVVWLALKLEPWVDAKGKPQAGLLSSLKTAYGQTFDAERRVYFLKQDEVKTFWLIRPRIPNDPTLPTVIEKLPTDDENRFLFDGSKWPAVAYWIDEAHDFFPMETPAKELVGVRSYMSQQGRAGDTCHIISQRIMNVSLAIRSMCQQNRHLVNKKFHKIWIFNQGNVIKWEIYRHTPPRDGEECMSSGSLRYDRKLIEGSYDTAAGNTVSGGVADTEIKPTGFHWAWGLAAVCLAAALAIIAIGSVGKWVVRRTKSIAGLSTITATTTQPVQQITHEATAAVARHNETRQTVYSQETQHTATPQTDGSKNSRKDAVKITGWGQTGHYAAVTTEDGQTIIGTNATLFADEITMDGRLYVLVGRRHRQ